MKNSNDKENNLKENYFLSSIGDVENNNININQKSLGFKCVLHCPLNINDCINSIDIFNNYIAYGTIMGDVLFCRIEEEHKLNNINNINKKYSIDINNTDVNISINKDIIEKDNNAKEIVLNINKNNKNNKNNENKTINEKENPKSLKIFLKGDEHQSTDNYSSINSHKNEKNKLKNNFIFPKIIKLIQGCVENICCISLINDILNFSVGDKEIIHCEKISSYYANDLSLSHNFKRIPNYNSENTHSDFCENCSCLISTNNYLIVYSYYSDFNWPLRFNQIKYENKNLTTYEIIRGNINMSNYNVPFDFDGDKFLYIEYYDESIRCINIYNTLNNKKIFNFLLEKKFGHISHMKLLPDDCIFLCRNLYVCEIYKYKYNVNISDGEKNEKNNNDFILLNMWVHHLNKEIISSNIYILGSKINNEFNINKKKNNSNKNEIYKNSQIKKENKKTIKWKKNIHNLSNEIDDNYSLDSAMSKNKILEYEKHNYKYNDILNFEDNNEEKNKKLDEKEKIERKLYKKDSLNVNFNESDNNIIQKKDKYYIITLDSDGNFNLYYNNSENKGIKNTLFNLYNIQNISQRYKNLTFFSIGFPYYITMNEYYYVITTDNGAFIISKNDEV